ncbi:MAG: SIS domain-containing protein [bacterium]|nr:SIS domain-containing protein [bacterium]
MSESLSFVVDYTKTAQKLLDEIAVTHKESSLNWSFRKNIQRLADLFISFGSHQSIFLVGNGGSAGIASIVANRLWKFCGIKGYAFNDSVIMSCAGNDYGWEEVFSKPLERYGCSGDILIAISSSGKSENILNAVRTAQEQNFNHIITLTGFDIENPLRKMGNTNFYVPSDSYRHVERTHLFILDCILDFLVERKNQKKGK